MQSILTKTMTKTTTMTTLKINCPIIQLILLCRLFLLRTSAIQASLISLGLASVVNK